LQPAKHVATSCRMIMLLTSFLRCLVSHNCLLKLILECLRRLLVIPVGYPKGLIIFRFCWDRIDCMQAPVCRFQYSQTQNIHPLCAHPFGLQDHLATRRALEGILTVCLEVFEDVVLFEREIFCRRLFSHGTVLIHCIYNWCILNLLKQSSNCSRTAHLVKLRRAVSVLGKYHPSQSDVMQGSVLGHS
jgi:hypothetical protein